MKITIRDVIFGIVTFVASSLLTSCAPPETVARQPAERMTILDSDIPGVCLVMNNVVIDCSFFSLNACQEYASASTDLECAIVDTQGAPEEKGGA